MKQGLKILVLGILAILGIIVAVVLRDMERSRTGTPDTPRGERPVDPIEQVRWLTRSRTRVTWCRQVEGELTDALGTGSETVLVGLDTDDDRGIRVILGKVDSYRKPMFTHDGERIVFSDYAAHKVMVVNWDGTGLTEVADGIGVDVWHDEETKTEWVYVIEGETDPQNAFNGETLVRVKLDEPGTREVVWTETRVAADGFRVSRDGKYASGLFPWKMAGVADLEDRTWDKKGKGCWTSMSPDNSYLMWIFDGEHRNVRMFAPGQLLGWKVNINGADGIDGYEVYHPRWSNRARYMCMTGPYKGGEGPNKIQSGGKTAEIFIGEFNPGMTEVSTWVKVTENDVPDFFPDVWIEKGGDSVAVNVGGTAGQSLPDAAERRLSLKVKLVEKTPTPTPKSILPYKRALIAHTYEVVDLLSGDYDGKRLFIAHWVIKDSKVLPAKWKLGQVRSLVIEHYDDHPELEGERVVKSVKTGGLPLYYEVSATGSDPE